MDLVDRLFRLRRTSRKGLRETSSKHRPLVLTALSVPMLWLALTVSADTPVSAGPERLFAPVAKVVDPPAYLSEAPWGDTPWRSIGLDPLGMSALTQSKSIELELLDDKTVVAEPWKSFENPSGSLSWVGKVQGDPSGLVVLVSRDGVIVGSIRTAGELFMLAFAGPSAGGAHILYQVDESSPNLAELPATPIPPNHPDLIRAQRRADVVASLGAEDDGSIQDLMVVYTPIALSEVGGVVAMENLLDLGVTETNLSYETSGIHHRLRLVHSGQTDFDEQSGAGDPRDLIQGQNDGFMDEVHGIRDQVAADLVMLIVSEENGGGCGRAFIMEEVSTAHAAFAFCYVNQVCVSPGYTFQHELGHIQAGLHQWTGPVENSPFTFNHGYTDPVNQFRTIMAAGSGECPDGCPRRLAWSNPDVLDAETGEPMGIPEGEPEAADNRKTLNATAWVVANFRVSAGAIFADGFESGDTTNWSVE